MNCRDMTATPVCLRSADGTQISAIAFHEIGMDADQVTLNASTRYTDASGEIFYDPIDFESVSVGACPTDAQSTHLIEGCIEVEGEKVSAFTIVDDEGNALFAPKPLRDLGFTECC